MIEVNMDPILEAAKIVPVFRRPIDEDPRPKIQLADRLAENHFKCGVDMNACTQNPLNMAGKYLTFWAWNWSPDDEQQVHFAATVKTSDRSWVDAVSKRYSIWSKLWQDRNQTVNVNLEQLNEAPELWVRLFNGGGYVEHRNKRANFAEWVEHEWLDDEEWFYVSSFHNTISGIYMEPQMVQPVTAYTIEEHHFYHMFNSGYYKDSTIVRSFEEKAGRNFHRRRRIELERI